MEAEPKSASEVLAENVAWRAIEERSLTDPLFRRMVDCVRFGGMTREQVLIQSVLALADSNAALTENLTRLLNTTVRSSVSVPAPPEEE